MICVERRRLLLLPADIAHLDDRLLAFVEENRRRRPVLIDSHPVTKGQYGYRVGDARRLASSAAGAATSGTPCRNKAVSARFGSNLQQFG
jgi:transposase